MVVDVPRRGATAGATLPARGSPQPQRCGLCSYQTTISSGGEQQALEDPRGNLRTANVGSIPFADIEALVKALGGAVTEREGSSVRIELKGEQWRCHRLDPGKEAKRYQVEQARELLERVGVQP